MILSEFSGIFYILSFLFGFTRISSDSLQFSRIPSHYFELFSDSSAFSRIFPYLLIFFWILCDSLAILWDSLIIYSLILSDSHGCLRIFPNFLIFFRNMFGSLRDSFGFYWILWNCSQLLPYSFVFSVFIRILRYPLVFFRILCLPPYFLRSFQNLCQNQNTRDPRAHGFPRFF